MKTCIIPTTILLIVLIMSAGCAQTAPQASPPAVPGGATAPAVVPSPAAGKYTDLTPAQARDLIATEKDLVIIDVSPYYAEGHLPGAVSIPLATLDAKIPSLDRTMTYLVYCHGDGPSMAGAQKLVDAGFAKVYRLSGNYAAWVGAGYPVEK